MRKKLQGVLFGAVALTVMLWTLNTGPYAFDGGPHDGTWRHWQLVPGGTTNGFDPHETVADPTGLTNHVGAPAMYTSMENVCGGNCGLLYWNPTTDVFKAYCVTGGFQFSGDLHLGAAAAAPGPPNFGGGDAWAVVHGNASFTPYMNFAGTNSLRRYNIGTSRGTGVRVDPTNGKVYVGNFVTAGQIIELDPATNSLRKWTTTCKPYNLVIDSPFVYATCVRSGAEPDQIVRLDTTVALLNVKRWTVPGASNFQTSVGFGIPNGISLDRDKNVWFSETTSDEVGNLDVTNDCFDEYTKVGVDAPQDVASSGSGATLQSYYTEVGTGQVLGVLTVSASTPATNCVVPTTETITPTTSTASATDFTLTPRTNVIRPVVTPVMSTNGNGIDRFPLPAGRTNPTAVTEVVFANTLYGSFEGNDDVFEFVSDIVIGEPEDDCENLDPMTQGFWRRVCKKNHPAVPDRTILEEGDGPQLCEDLNPDPHSDPCERARSQCAATQFNVLSGKLDDIAIVDSTGESVAEAIAAAQALIDEGTNQSCKDASGLCGGINEGGVDCPGAGACPCATDHCIDLDGIATPQAGTTAEVTPGDLLASFPVTGVADAGVDWFDNDGDGQWTIGIDDLHSEDNNTCPGAIRDGDHDLGLDCQILDIDGSLFDGQQVDCDLEVNFPFVEPHLSNGGCPSTLNNIRYFDTNGDGSWDDGDDIILDINGNGICD